VEVRDYPRFLPSYSVTSLLPILLSFRNVGLLFVFVFALMTLYLVATETIKGKKSKGEIIIFPRRKMPKNRVADIEGAGKGASVAQKEREKDEVSIQRQTAIFHWQDVCYDVQIKKETRRILDHVDGWVKPGTLTALMVSRDDGCRMTGNGSDECVCVGCFWSW
jgi:hypothetical protein